MIGPRGFELSAICTPVLFRHGRHHPFVPFAYGEWLVLHIDAAEAALTDDDEHLTLTARHLDEVDDWLLARLR